MRRDQLATLGIQLPVLPTIVIGGLPGEPDWAPWLERIGLDVASSGAVSDTVETYAAAGAAVPHRPVLAEGALAGARLVHCEGDPPDGAYRVHPDELVVIEAGAGGDANEVARRVLAVVRSAPSEWWIAASGLRTVGVDVAERSLREFVEGVRQVRLYLAKQQFD
jgi:hypothetical protein